MTRKAIFSAVKSARGKPWDDASIAILDKALDQLGVPIDDAETLKPSDAAFALIKSFEGLHKVRPDGRIEAYPDPGSGGDPWTIGYGSTGPDIKRGTVWTRQEVNARFDADLIAFANGVAKLVVGVVTTQNEYDALLSFAYNVGLGALGSSTLLKKHKAGDKAGAAKEFSKWVNASGRPMKGLTRRREAESKLYRGEP